MLYFIDTKGVHTMRLSQLFFWKKNSSQSTYSQILIYFVVACATVLALSSIFFYLLASKTILNEIGDHSDSQLTNSAESTATTMEWTLDFSLKSSLDSNIFAYALQAHSDSFQEYGVWRMLTNLKAANPLIESIYLINGYNQTIIDTKYGVTSIDHFYDQDILQILKNGKTAANQLIVPRLLETNYVTLAKSRLISIIVPYESGVSLSSFVVNINADALLSLFKKDALLKGSHVFIINNKHEIISSTLQTDFMTNVSELQYFNKLTQQQGWFEYKINKQNYLIVYANTLIRGLDKWSIIETIPEANILSNIQSIRNITIAFFITLLLFIFIIIRKISKRIYSPIQELVMKVTAQYREPTAEKIASNELAYLSDIFSDQNIKLNQLSDYRRNQKFSAKEALFKQLLESSAPSSTELRRMFTELEVILPFEGLAIALFRIDHLESFVQLYPTKDQRLLRFAMTNIVKEHLQQFYRIETVDMGNDHIAAVYHLDNTSITAIEHERFIQCQAYLQQYLGIKTSLTLSPLLENYLELEQSYEKTYDLSNERFKLGWGQLILTDEQPDNTLKLFRYPEEMERELLNSIRHGNRNQALDQLQAIWKFLQQYSYFESKQAITYIMMNMGSTLARLPQQTASNNQWGLAYIERQISRLETMEAVMQWLQERLEAVFTDMEHVRKLSKNTNLTNEIKLQIEQQLTDQNLSSKLISDQLELSVNYIRNLFKTETNQSITDYITERRLDKVTDQLIRTQLPIDEIVLQCGFTSPNSFYAIFKKKYGITPAKYRQDQKNEG